VSKTRSTSGAVDGTSQPVDVLVAISRDGAARLGTQIEGQLRAAVRSGSLQPGVRLPSTRDLARELAISRRVVVEAYAQLAAEGYLVLRQGARPTVARLPLGAAGGDDPVPAAVRHRYDFRLSRPDVSAFPRSAWLRSLRDALATISDSELGYGDARGVERLRTALSAYLGRVRGVVSDPSQLLVTCGSMEGQGLVFRVLAAQGARRIAFEDPCLPDHRRVAERAGLEPVPIEVDRAGIRVDELRRADVSAVVLTPAHQHPTGAVLSGERRAALLDWLRETDAIAIEDDYDAEFRYDRAAIGSLQGLDPERIVYAGTASKTLAPGLRLGWLVAPRRLVAPLHEEKLMLDRGNARIEQLAFADFLDRGEYDRHLRRMRSRYRRRRDALVAALGRELPEAEIDGIAAGLHATVRLPAGDDEQAILAEGARRRLGLAALGDFRAACRDEPATLLLGYGQLPEPAIAAGVAELGEAVRAARQASGGRRSGKRGSPSSGISSQDAA
jgi:GntR family transcriptional regulator/MocR family aminotransferase